ncbi:MAG: hypothetical protein ACO3N2_04730 [Arenicellales bacterium]
MKQGINEFKMGADHTRTRIVRRRSATPSPPAPLSRAWILMSLIVN